MKQDGEPNIGQSFISMHEKQDSVALEYQRLCTWMITVYLLQLQNSRIAIESISFSKCRGILFRSL